MRGRASVRLFLLSVSGFVLVLSCGRGGGDSYRSEVYDAWDPRYRGGIEVSGDRKKVRIYGNIRCGNAYRSYTGAWVDIRRGGVSEFTYRCGSLSVVYRLEIRNGKFRVQVRNLIGGWADMCPSGGGSSVAGSYRVDTSSDGKIRFCRYGWGGWICGRWVSYICGPSCPSGYTYNPSRDVCEAEPSYNCPSGYVYNSSTGKCEKNPDVSYTCPSDPNRPCIQEGSGYFCSPYECYDAQTTPTEVTDTPEGINDIPADGEVTAQGCMGTVYIFNGRDMRCRRAGTQTGFRNCCSQIFIGPGFTCNETERQLLKLKEKGNCVFVGDYCAEWWPFKLKWICVQRKETYCCFSSPLARIIHEQGRPQLGIGWGTPENPNCRGFTAEEFQKLDFSKIDFSEWIEGEVKGSIVPRIETNIRNVVEQIPSQLK